MKTLVLGASLKSERYSNKAINSLRENGIPVNAIGLREGSVSDVNIQTSTPIIKDVHTVTMYLNAKRQEAYYEYILGLNPKRIIFNPGAENPELQNLAKEQGILVENACTLVMLRLGNYKDQKVDISDIM